MSGGGPGYFGPQADRGGPEGVGAADAHLDWPALESPEKERERISKELHDELGQSLLFQKIQLSFIRDRLTRKQARLKSECGDLLNHLDRTIENMRRLSKDLKPWGLDELGFPLSAKLLIEESCKLYGIASHQVKWKKSARCSRRKSNSIFIASSRNP